MYFWFNTISIQHSGVDVVVPVPDEVAAELIEYGQITFESGLIYGNFGNLSTKRDGVEPSAAIDS